MPVPTSSSVSELWLVLFTAHPPLVPEPSTQSAVKCKPVLERLMNACDSHDRRSDPSRTRPWSPPMASSPRWGLAIVCRRRPRSGTSAGDAGGDRDRGAARGDCVAVVGVEAELVEADRGRHGDGPGTVGETGAD